uniref:Peptide deformylase n=1 Tax=uncultured marine bacterium 313 TaxID=257386 RepID=Q6SHN7_9BACT|nr:polypeptide deformylase [uncultured marine bacterium 313]
MALRKILTEPNKLLREKSLTVKEVDEDLQKLMNDMLETMYAAPGIGLAAIQVGVPKRVIVLDIGWRDKPESTNDEKQDERKNPIYFVNPEIITKSTNNSTYEEGCLSVPGQFAEIDRPDKCHIKYLDYYGQPKELMAEGMFATCIQHEIDHLEGILFIDYLSKLKKSMIVKKLAKQKEQLDRIVI